MDGILTVTPAPLTVTVLPTTSSRLYGSANPIYTGTLKGLVNGDTVTVTPVTSASTVSPAGMYSVTATVNGPSALNYALTVIDASLQIRKASLSVAALSQNVTYGQPQPILTAYTLKGFLNGDTASVVSGAPALSTNVTSKTPVGYYPIQTGIGTLTAANYSFAPLAQQGVVQVMKAALTVKANNLTMQVGGPIPPLTYSFTGFVNGDSAASSVTGSPTLSTTATTHSKPGTFPIYISTGSLAASNYRITGVAGVLTIVP